MNEKTLVICDKEARYAKGLGDNISERKEFAFKVYACTSAESVKCFLDSHHIDILIIDEGFTWGERKDFGAEVTFVLSRGSCKDLLEEEVELFKYQSADAILAEVVESYLRKSNVTILKNVKKQSKKMIAVYSPVHRIGKSIFAMALSRELAKEKKTLYVNLEAYPILKEEGKNLGDLMYYARQEQDELGSRLASIVRVRDGLEYLIPIPLITDLKEITVNEWRNLFEKILEESLYENLVLDLDDSVDGLFEILQLCDWIYTPVLDEERANQKVSRYENALQLLGLSSVLEKSIRFIVQEDMAGYARKVVREEEA